VAVWGPRVRKRRPCCRLGVGGGGASAGRCEGGSEVGCGKRAARSAAGRHRAGVSEDARQFTEYKNT
jgi:hypothetical protein